MISENLPRRTGLSADAGPGTGFEWTPGGRGWEAEARQLGAGSRESGARAGSKESGIGLTKSRSVNYKPISKADCSWAKRGASRSMEPGAGAMNF